MVAAEGRDGFVVFDGVQKSYDGETLVVKDLNRSVAKGEFLTMLGPSGSGKTTCLMMLAGFETATSGEIMLDGRPINTVPPHKRGIGMVFQNYALLPHMTVGENLSFAMEVRGMGKSEREKKVMRALDMVLMDEPLGALDIELREHMQFEIKRLAHDLGFITVYVTRDQTEALTMSDNVAVFEDGRIQQLDLLAVLYEEPKNSFVAQFIGENNSLDGVVKENRGEPRVVQLDEGALIDAKPVNVTKAGERTRVSIRPGRVEANKDQLDPEAHLIRAEVIEFIYSSNPDNS